MTDIARLGLYVDSSGVVRATKELRAMEQQGGRTENRTDKATSKMSAGFARLGKAGALAAVAIASVVTAKAISDITEFTAAISELSAITGATGKDLEFYADSAKEIGRTTSLSASQAAQAFKLIASAKPDLLENAEALQQVTRDAVTLAEATGMDLPAAAEALGGALNQFQIDATKSAEVINILAASSKLGTAEVANVTEALRNAGPAANSLGIDLAETVAGIQALAKSGRQGADAGTGLRQVLLQLERTADAELQPSIVGLSGALEELASRNLTNNELIKLFGQEAFSAVTALIATRDTVADLNVSLRDTDTAFEQAAVRMDNLRGDTLELKSAVEGLSIELGEQLEPMLRKATQGLTGFINEITKLISGSASVDDLTAELQELEDKLANSRFFGRSGANQKSALRAEIEEIRKELNLAKAEAGETSAVADLLAEKRAELAELESRPNGGRMRGGRNSPIAQLRTEIKELEEQLRASAPIIEQGKKLVEETETVITGGGSTNTNSGSAPTPSEPDLGPTIRFDPDNTVKTVDLIAERYAELQTIAERLSNELRTPQEIYQQEIELLNELRETRRQGTDEGLISFEQYVRGVEEAQERLANSTQSTAEEMNQFMIQAARSMQSALSDGFFSIMQGEFDNLGDSFKRTIDRMVSDLLASQFSSFLLGNFGSTGKVGGFVGNVLGGLFGGARAAGGPVEGGKTYLVGEKGPELFTPPGNGSIIPNNQMQSGGGMTVNVNISGVRDGRDIRASADQAAMKLMAAGQRAMQRNG